MPSSRKLLLGRLFFQKDERGKPAESGSDLSGRRHFKRLVIERLTATDDEMKEAIKQMDWRKRRSRSMSHWSRMQTMYRLTVDFKASAVQ